MNGTHLEKDAAHAQDQGQERTPVGRRLIWVRHHPFPLLDRGRVAGVCPEGRYLPPLAH